MSVPTLSHTPPMFIWLAVQVVALALSAFRVPLWAHAPQTGEFLALHFLLVAQSLGAALLMPRLLADWRIAAMAAASAWPLIILAGFIGAASGATIALAGAFITAWLFCLWIWLLTLSGAAGRMRASAVAATWSAGGVVMQYCRLEFAPAAPSFGAAMHGAMGPVVGALAVLDPANPYPAWPWLALATAACAGLFFLLAKKLSGSKNADRPNAQVKAIN